MPQPAPSYFNHEAAFWRDVYASRKVEGAIYGARLERALALVDRIPNGRGRRALELGCGAGHAAAAMARRGFEVMATDLVEEMAQLAREAASQASPGKVRVACADAGSLPFASGSFDCVLAIAILEWVRSPELALAEIRRVLKPGGYVVLSATNVWGLQRLLDPRLWPLFEPVKRWAKRSSSHLRSTARARTHTARELLALIEGAGLIALDHLTAGYGPVTFFKQRLLPGPAGIRLHRALQGAADHGLLWLGRIGYSHLVFARRPAGAAGIGSRSGERRQPAPVEAR